MKIGLFIPCYVDAVYPNVGVATYKLLKHLGLDVTYPLNQTCCGQPMANAGFEKMAVPLAEKFEDMFKEFDYVVAPSVMEGKKKCVTAEKALDVIAFLHDVVKVKSLPGEFPHKVSLHNSCHGVRELGLSSPSEMHVDKFNKIKDLLELKKGIEVVEPERPDECCGFGGMFSIEETAISAQMGHDKVKRHIETGAEYVTGPDCSCLMHMAGVAQKRDMKIKFIHAVEILAAGL